MRVFTEIQKLPKWLFIVIVPSFLVAVSLVINAYVNASTAAEEKELLFALIAVVVAESIAVFFIATVKQVVRVDNTGVYYKYPPFKRKEVHIPITKIKHYDLVTYPHIYYGYHVGFWNFLRKEPSISTLGVSKAIRLTFNDHKTLLIGTGKPDELLKTLNYNTQKRE